MTRAAVLRLSAAAGLLGAMVWLADPVAVLKAISDTDVLWLLSALLVSVLSNAASALRWRMLCTWLGQHLSPVDAITVYFRAMALNGLLPGAVVGGDLYRALSLKKSGQPTLEAGLSVLLDRASGLWMLMIVGALALAAGSSPFSALPAAHWLTLAALALWCAPLPAMPLMRRFAAQFASSASDGWRGRWGQRLDRIARRPAVVRQWGLQSLGSGAVQGLSIVAFALGGRALGVDLPAWTWAAVAAPVFLMAALPLSVGGWGTREAAATVCLGLFGVPAAQAIGVSVLYGVCGLLQALAGSLLFAVARPVAPRP